MAKQAEEQIKEAETGKTWKDPALEQRKGAACSSHGVVQQLRLGMAPPPSLRDVRPGKAFGEGKPKARFAEPGPIPRSPSAWPCAVIGKAYQRASARGPEISNSRTPQDAADLPKRIRSPGPSKRDPDWKARTASTPLQFLKGPRPRARCLRHA